MKKTTAVVSFSVLLAVVLFCLWVLRGRNQLHFDTPYQAVLLDNGQSFYGKIERISSQYLSLGDVYYVQQQANPQTKEVKSVLVRRGTEWHGPSETVINERHIVMIETVTPGSKVAELIAELKRKGP